MIFKPWRSAMDRTASQSGVLPMRLGSKMAPVEGVISSSMRFTSALKVSSSTSTRTGTRPARMRGAMSVEKVSPAVITSWPRSSPRSSTARYRPEEPELHITAAALPNRDATCLSMALTRRPTHNPCGSFRTSTTASISA